MDIKFKKIFWFNNTYHRRQILSTSKFNFREIQHDKFWTWKMKLCYNTEQQKEENI